MASAYTPGLKVVARTVFEKERKLPMKGKVVVNVGDKITAETVVAETHLPGNPVPFNFANTMGCEPKEILEFLDIKVGDTVRKGDTIAETSGFFGWFKTKIQAPVDGVVENISTATGNLLFREPPIPVQVLGYVDGQVAEVFPDEGILVRSAATFIQGIFGIGPETVGPLKMLARTPADVLDENSLSAEDRGKIVVGGALVTAAALNRAIELGVKGVIVGGYDAQDLKEFLGFDLGVAITGSEEKGITLVVTEGFGQIDMAQKTFDLLKSLEGKKTSINGATQIRAGVIRPEIVIPIEDSLETVAEGEKKLGMRVGSLVRIIRQPYFGAVAKVVALPEKPVVIPTEAKVRVVEIELLAGGERFVLPRANVETIEG